MKKVIMTLAAFSLFASGPAFAGPGCGSHGRRIFAWLQRAERFGAGAARDRGAQAAAARQRS